METWVIIVICIAATAVVVGFFACVACCFNKDPPLAKSREIERGLISAKHVPHLPQEPRTPGSSEASIDLDPNDPLSKLPLTFDMSVGTRRGVPHSGYLWQYTDPDAIVFRQDGIATTRRINQRHELEARPDLVGALIQSPGSPGGVTVGEMRFDAENVDRDQDPHSGVSANLASIGGPAPPRRYAKRMNTLPALGSIRAGEVVELAPIMPNGVRLTKDLAQVERPTGVPISLENALIADRQLRPTLPGDKDAITPMPFDDGVDTVGWKRPHSQLGRRILRFQTLEADDGPEEEMPMVEKAIIRGLEHMEMQTGYVAEEFLPPLPER